MASNRLKLNRLLDKYQAELFTLHKVSMNDFIGVICTNNIDAILHASHALVHGIYSIFLLQLVTGHMGVNPMSLKKLLAGAKVWVLCNEILG